MGDTTFIASWVTKHEQTKCSRQDISYTLLCTNEHQNDKNKNKTSLPNHAARLLLLDILGQNDIYPASAIPTADGFPVAPSLDKETDILFGEERFNFLTSSSFTPILPPEIKA